VLKSSIWRLTIDTNPEDCNLSCTMCEEHSPHSTFMQELFATTGKKHRRMPENWLESIFQQAKKLGVTEIIPSTMGEPLIYKYFGRIVDLCYEYGIKMNLTTNGTFPKISGKTAKEWARLIVPITTDVKISWNGATAKTNSEVMLGIDFEKTIQNVKDFIAIRNRHFEETGYFCRVTFQLTFMQNNMHELADIIRLAAELDIDRVKGHHLWAHFDEIKTLSFKHNAESIQQWNQYVNEALIAAERYRKPNGQKVLLENIIPLYAQETNSVPEQYECPFLNKELWISATGKISPCCAPDALRNMLGDFGNFETTTLQKAIESAEYQYLANNYRSVDLCKTCSMRKPI
jgi:MoaA/NifB/PqqE/SkfB family radical SAM enzyme